MNFRVFSKLPKDVVGSFYNLLRASWSVLDGQRMISDRLDFNQNELGFRRFFDIAVSALHVNAEAVSYYVFTHCVCVCVFCFPHL